jgi:hypothetical protein
MLDFPLVGTTIVGLGLLQFILGKKNWGGSNTPWGNVVNALNINHFVYPSIPWGTPPRGIFGMIDGPHMG